MRDVTRLWQTDRKTRHARVRLDLTIDQFRGLPHRLPSPETGTIKRWLSQNTRESESWPW